MTDSYSWGNLCPCCHEPITNTARMCHEHANQFKAFLRTCYGGGIRIGRRPAPTGKGEKNRLAVLEALAGGPMSTPKLAGEVGMTVEGTRYACKVLLKRGQVEKTNDRHRHVWALAGPVFCEEVESDGHS